MAAKNDASFTFDQCGGHLAVDFANTVSSRHTQSPIERLTDYPTRCSPSPSSRA